jgi:hypothetical protein
MKSVELLLSAGSGSWPGGEPLCPFFNHPKATLPALPRLVQLTGARAVPLLACYDEQAHGYRLEVEAPFADYPSEDLMADTCRMNDSVEQQLCRHPGQYMWFLKIFDTREDQVGRMAATRRGSGASAGALLLILSLRSPGAKMWPQAGHFLFGNLSDQ